MRVYPAGLAEAGEVTVADPCFGVLAGYWVGCRPLLAFDGSIDTRVGAEP